MSHPGEAVAVGDLVCYGAGRSNRRGIVVALQKSYVTIRGVKGGGTLKYVERRAIVSVMSSLL